MLEISFELAQSGDMCSPIAFYFFSFEKWICADMNETLSISKWRASLECIAIIITRSITVDTIRCLCVSDFVNQILNFKIYYTIVVIVKQTEKRSVIFNSKRIYFIYKKENQRGREREREVMLFICWVWVHIYAIKPGMCFISE